MCIKIFSEKTAKVLSWVGLALILIGASVFILCRSWDFSWSINEAIVGQFGDFVGGVVGCIFAFVGVILYYVALTDQREDIKINREALKTQINTLEQQIKEFKAQTAEMQETRTVYEEQTKLYRQQTEYYKQQVKELKNQTKISILQHFNSEFYSLLNVFLNIKIECNESIKSVLETLENRANSDTGTLCDKHSRLIQEFTNQYFLNTNTLSNFFKTLYRILKLIDDSNIELSHKERYAKTLRSQLSEKELLILYYDYCSDLGEKVRILASKYNILKHLAMMDKYEINIQELENCRSSILPILNYFSELLDIKIKQSQDLETEDDIVANEEILFAGITSRYNLIINDQYFVFGIEFPIEHNENVKENIKNLILMFLYEYFFLSKFKKPIENIFEKQIIENDNTITIQYITEQKNIL